jgi:tRNA wybutosine-synthesizing protein 4
LWFYSHVFPKEMQEGSEKKKEPSQHSELLQRKLNVARTNDESVVSKRSAAREYFVDPFLPHFVRKPAKRAALINRGYYIRRQSVFLAVERFLSLHGSACQIVSLGAGFDTLFFVLSSHPNRPQRMFEMDFPNVVKNKSILIAGTPLLRDVVGKAEIDPETGEIESDRYSLLCGDLCDIAAVKTKFQKHKLSFDLPTLFLAECVFTYMTNADSDRIIYWAASAPFPTCSFVVYEQIKPDDAFGRTMRANLHARGSDLLGIHGYPDVLSQEQRFRKLGFATVNIRTMLDVYLADLPKEERARIDSLEEFDEHEEWREKCGHYILSYASTSKNLLLPFSVPVATRRSKAEMTGCVVKTWHGCKELSLKTTGRVSELKRWGHSVCLASANRVVLFGGYGGGARHERLNSVAVLQDQVLTLPSVTGVAPSTRVLHGCCMIENDRMLVHGGRSGPAMPMNDVFVLDCAAMQWKKVALAAAAPLPFRYRHSLTRADTSSLAIGFGGRLGWRHGEESNELWLLNVDAKEWHPIVFSDGCEKPVARSSHVACWHQGALYIHGGLSDEDGVLNDLWKLSFDAKFNICVAERMDIRGLPHRFSHSAVSIGDSIFFIAGQDETIEHSVHVYDAVKREVVAVLSLNETWSRTRAVAVANQVLLIGGGLTCFSFGSVFCEDIVTALVFPDLIVRAESYAPSPLKEQRSDLSLRSRRAIARIENATRDQFRDQVLRVREPCIFSGSKDVPTWSKEDVLASVPPETMASIHVCDGPLLDFANKNYRFDVVPFAEMLNMMENSDAHLYFRSLGENARKDPSNVSESFPKLAEKFLVPDFAKDLVVPESIHSSCLRFSSNDIQMWTHYDINDNILVGLRGRKRLVLFHPEEIRHLYADGTASGVLNVDDPDLRKFPMFAKAIVWEGILEEGDVLFIPAMWWHNVRTLSVCYGLNVFFRHLSSERYQSNDLYGNKDPLLAVAAEKAVKQAIASLSDLPEEYRRFFARKLILEMKKSLL